VAPSNVDVGPWRPPTPSEAVPPGLEETAADASQLVDFNPNQYAGSWYEPSTQRVTIASVTGAIGSAGKNARRLSADNDVTVVPAQFSLAEGQKALDEFMATAAIAHRVVNFGVAPDGNGFQLDVLGEPTADELQGLSVLPGHVDVRTGLTDAGHPTDAMNDASPFAGGSRFGSIVPGGTTLNVCTSGFPFLGDSGVKFLLTAGHCVPKGSTWKIYKLNGPVLSPTLDVQIAQNDSPGARTSWDSNAGTVNAGGDSAKHGDVAMFNVSAYGKDIGDSIWISQTAKRNVVSRDTPSVGGSVCRAGIRDWETCGFTIDSVNTSHTYNDGTTIRQGDLAYLASSNTCSLDGDSGAPVYRRTNGDAIAIGIVSGTYSVPTVGGCMLVFTGVEEAIQAWGGDLKYH
jgi:hypothetical protein